MKSDEQRAADAAHQVREALQAMEASGVSRDEALSIAMCEAAFSVAAEHGADVALRALALTANAVCTVKTPGVELAAARPAGHA